MYPNPDETQNGLSDINRSLSVFTGSALQDASAIVAADAAVVFAGHQVVGAGPLKPMLELAGPDAKRVDLPGHLLVPGLVNAHAHLELTSIGPRPYAGSFTGWIGMVRDASKDADADAATQQGAALSHEAGVLTVGDIASTFRPPVTRDGRWLRGVGFTELFGLGGPTLDDAMTFLERPVAHADGPFAQGLQPHAPYSAGPDLFRACVDRAGGRPLCTHLAETPDEQRFVSGADGPFQELLASMGKWSPDLAGPYQDGLSPIAWLDAVLGDRSTHFLLAHCNYADDADIDILARRHWSVVYCPRASAYFGHRDHPYRRMLAAGVNVCLGTDSIVCHGTLSILDEMRLLHRRDQIDAATLLEMATTSGMRGLGMDAAHSRFEAGAAPGLVAVAYDRAEPAQALEAILADKANPAVRVLVDAGPAA